jgi:hypothetical protein
MAVDHEAPKSCGQASAARSSLRRALVLSLLLLALRLPLLNHPFPVHIDEVDFMLGLGFPRQYPVHHPGYPLWIGLGTLLHDAGFEPYRSYQAWSLLGSIIAPLLLYIGLRWRLGDTQAWWLAFAFGVNPLVWFQATMAQTYMAAGALGLLAVGLSYQAIANLRAAAAWWAAFVLVIAAFLRPDLLLALGPLVVYSAWRSPRHRAWPAVLVLLGGFAALLAVTSWLYSRADLTQVHPRLSHTIEVILGTSVFRLGFVDGFLRNAVKIVINLAWDFGLAALLLPWALWTIIRQSDGPPRPVLFLSLWTGPLLAFLLLAHVVQGYFMLLLPAGYWAIGLALNSKCGPRIAARMAAILAACSLLQFVLYPWSAESKGLKRLVDAKIAFQSAHGLQHIDHLPEIHMPGDFWPTAAHQPTDQLEMTTRPAPAPIRGE